MAKEYFHTLSAIRGIAAILVVAYHTSTYLSPIYFPNAALAVDLFFLLSGVVLDASYGSSLTGAKLSVMDFTKIRLIRIYPLYALSLIITLATVFMTNSHLVAFDRSFVYGFKNFWLSFGYAALLLPGPDGDMGSQFPLNPPSWTLFFELFINLVYALIARALSNRLLVTIIAVCALEVAANILIFPRAGAFGYWSTVALISGFCQSGFSYFTGVAIYRIHRNRQRTSSRFGGPASWAILTGVTILLTFPMMAAEPYFHLFAVLFAFPILIYAALPLEITGTTRRLYEILGDTSYAIYVTHWPLVAFFATLLSTLTVSITPPPPGPGSLSCYVS